MLTTTTTLAPRRDLDETFHLLEHGDYRYNTLVIHQDETAAQRCVEAAEHLGRNPDGGCGTRFGSSVEICCIDGVSIRLTPNNNIHIKLPNAGRRYAYDYPTILATEHRASDGSRIYFDRKFAHRLSQAVIDKLADLLARQNAVIEHEIEDDLCNPPADLLVEDDTVEETPSTIDLLR